MTTIPMTTILYWGYNMQENDEEPNKMYARIKIYIDTICEKRDWNYLFSNQNHFIFPPAAAELILGLFVVHSLWNLVVAVAHILCKSQNHRISTPLHNTISTSSSDSDPVRCCCCFPLPECSTCEICAVFNCMEISDGTSLSYEYILFSSVE